MFNDADLDVNIIKIENIPQGGHIMKVSIIAKNYKLSDRLQENIEKKFDKLGKYFSDDIIVMYLGQMVEKAPSDILFKNPLHPYTKALLSAIPIADPDMKMERITLHGEITSPINPKEGCRFAKRCPYATEKCTSQPMKLVEMEENHFVSCIRCQEHSI